MIWVRIPVGSPKATDVSVAFLLGNEWNNFDQMIKESIDISGEITLTQTKLRGLAFFLFR